MRLPEMGFTTKRLRAGFEPAILLRDLEYDVEKTHVLQNVKGLIPIGSMYGRFTYMNGWFLW